MVALGSLRITFIYVAECIICVGASRSSCVSRRQMMIFSRSGSLSLSLSLTASVYTKKNTRQKTLNFIYCCDRGRSITHICITSRAYRQSPRMSSKTFNIFITKIPQSYVTTISNMRIFCMVFRSITA